MEDSRSTHELGFGKKSKGESSDVDRLSVGQTRRRVTHVHALSTIPRVATYTRLVRPVVRWCSLARSPDKTTNLGSLSSLRAMSDLLAVDSQRVPG